ncbi:MAG: septation protein SpoVG family protein [Cryobacterium sp.]|nr:septation protein SpoVG family protein [Oligoflexia bacterium]
MEIIEIKVWPVKGKSSLKAKVDVSFQTSKGEIALKGFRVVEMSGKGQFVAPPQEKYQDKNGKTAYKEMLWTSRTLQAHLYPKIIESYNTHPETRA